MARPRVRRGFLPAESEAAWQQKVTQLALSCGWRVYHPPDNRPSGNTGRVQAVEPGYPDLTLVRGDRLLFAELKAEKGRLGPGQQEWLDALAAAGAETRLWRPSDWDEVVAVLR
jgi:hypothetical protein